MKRLLVVLILLTTFFSCKTDDPTITKLFITGNIKNPIMNAVLFKGHDINKTIPLNDDGSFKELLDIKQDGYFSLTHGHESSILYLKQGDSLNIAFDTNNFNASITFKGNLAEENRYLILKSKFIEENSIDYPMLFSMEQLEFHQTINKLKTKTDQLIENTPNLDSNFVELEKKSNYFDYLIKLQTYPSYHASFTKNKNVQLTNEFTKPFEEFDYSNQYYYTSFQNYKQIVLNHYKRAIIKNEDIANLFVQLNQIKSTVIKNDIVKSLSKNLELNYENNKVLYEGIMLISDDEVFKNKLTTQYNKVKLLSKGMPSPKFNDYENHKGGKTSLDDLKGKYLYIDIWATWCAPCIREIPYLKALEYKFQDKNIDFVSISIDRHDDYDTWRKMVMDKDLQGIQLLADSDWKSNFIKQYNIIGIPRFIILDADGNIVSANAQRPSSHSLELLLNDLVK
ncbi:TlpA family protein disulfide reductase [Pontimicrobium aquaticum]|uniref:TlpA family protein disulfide reductase n=1 Tax=Pontimicrobium aquaticum TaxID=2565367 RepID=A0A4U0ERP8_9FLAO|nr:TlpA disulfide reductase family protein [Pontimicrobium aquaticum]TJY33874.1 TlpA family protein disulfide reductase [Pontimicrobium aquaticum]